MRKMRERKSLSLATGIRHPVECRTVLTGLTPFAILDESGNVAWKKQSNGSMAFALYKTLHGARKALKIAGSPDGFKLWSKA